MDRGGRGRGPRGRGFQQDQRGGFNRGGGVPQQNRGGNGGNRRGGGNGGGGGNGSGSGSQEYSRGPQQRAADQYPPPQGAWGQQRAGPAPTPGSSHGPRPPCPAPTSGPGVRAPVPFTAGRATQDAAVAVSDEARGAVRGKRVIADVVNTRPSNLVSKAGVSGRRVNVQANYFAVLKKPEWSIHQYRVDFSPEVDILRNRRVLVSQLREDLGGYLFDGAVLFCTVFLPEAKEPTGKVYMLKNEAEETIVVKIRHVGIVDNSDIQSLQVLNLIIRRSMEGLKLQQLQRNYFDPVEKKTVENFHIEVWPGYQTSIRQHEKEILLCAEIQHKVMRMESLYKILLRCSKESGDYQQAFKKEVVGMIVLTDYNNKTYRVDDVDFNLNPTSTFDTKDGAQTYMNYYKKRYNLNIQDAKQPLMISRATDRSIRGGENDLVMLIPELCRATGLTDAMRSDFRLMKALGEFTRLAPDARIDRLKAFNRRLLGTPQSVNVLQSWNLELDTNLVELPGRILQPQKIIFGGQKKYMCDDRADWTREFRNTSMYTHTDILRWYVIVPRRNVKEVQDFVRMCQQAANGMHMRIDNPRYEEMNDDRNASYAQAIENTATKDPQMLMIVLNAAHEEKYSCIKKKTCIDRPVPSQVVTLRVVAPRGNKAQGLMSVATKVVIQMNAKLNGAPWMVELPLRGLMTVGFDVCHSAKDKNKSYGALVATMDLTCSARYFSSVTEHMKGQELSNEVVVKMTMALKAYRETHNTLPDRIIFYRDGVGDGQLHQVYSTEVELLKKSLDEIYKTANAERGYRLSFIVVSKRINTRYFVNRRNPPPGTVVDDIITLPERFDFFLVSQSVRQGTVSPTSYNVLHDNSGLDADKLQILTYKMTHLYYNFSSTIRIPAVCKYAHKLAFLVAESLHRTPSTQLQNQLYFL